MTRTRQAAPAPKRSFFSERQGNASCGHVSFILLACSMLSFIWHLRGTVALDARFSNAAVLDEVERLLEKQRKGNRLQGADSISFDDPLWSNIFGPNWLAMVIYDRGQFWIESGQTGRTLRYDLRSLHGMAFCLLGAFMFFSIGLLSGGLFFALKLATGCFAWLYGMNMLLAHARVPLAIHKAANHAYQ